MLIVGKDGFIGSALFAEAVKRGLDPVGTTRRGAGAASHLSWFLDLEGDFAVPPVPDVAYLLAGVIGYRNCEGSSRAYRVNVDGTVRLAKMLVSCGTFIVFMSSDAVEYGLGSAYGTHKALVEIFLQSVCDPAIVRAPRIAPAALPQLCDLLLDIGTNRKPGIFNFMPAVDN